MLDLLCGSDARSGRLFLRLVLLSQVLPLIFKSTLASTAELLWECAGSRSAAKKARAASPKALELIYRRRTNFSFIASTVAER